MCGLVGYKPLGPTPETTAAFTRLFKASIIRGMHAYGISTAILDGYEGSRGGISTERSFDWNDIPRHFHTPYPTIAHTRYCQSGDWQVMENNQPIEVAGMALAFNGCIHMGTKEEFEAAFDVQCETDNDGEVFLRLVESVGLLHPSDHIERAKRTLGGFTGSFAGVWLHNGYLYAGRNARRPLWSCEAFGGKFYASTRDIFRRAGFPEPQQVVVGVELA